MCSLSRHGQGYLTYTDHARLFVILTSLIANLTVYLKECSTMKILLVKYPDCSLYELCTKYSLPLLFVGLVLELGAHLSPQLFLVIQGPMFIPMK